MSVLAYCTTAVTLLVLDILALPVTVFTGHWVDVYPDGKIAVTCKGRVIWEKEVLKPC